MIPTEVLTGAIIGGRTLWQIVLPSGAHFILGFSVGSLVAYWILTTCLPGGLDGRADRCTGRCSVLLVLSASIVSHVLEDFVVRKF